MGSSEAPAPVSSVASVLSSLVAPVPSSSRALVPSSFRAPVPTIPLLPPSGGDVFAAMVTPARSSFCFKKIAG